MNAWIRKLRFIFRGTIGVKESVAALVNQRVAFHRAVIVLHAYYLIQFFDGILLLREWESIFTRPRPDPLWPVFWMQWVTTENLTQAITFILLLHLLGSLAALSLPHSRVARILAFLGMLEWVAYNYSFGKIGHSMHLMIYVSFLLIFLPSQWTRPSAGRLVRQKVLNIHLACVASILIPYTLAGLIKLWVGIGQLVSGQYSIFHPEALGRQIADRLLQSGNQSVLGSWLVQYAEWTWILMWPTIYLEIIAVYAIFRPAIRIIVGIALLLFHIMSFFTMTIIFQQACAMIVLFLLISLEDYSRTSWRQRILELPLPYLSYLRAKNMPHASNLRCAGKNV